MNTIRENLERVRDDMRKAAIASGRDAGSIKLVAVSKTVAPDRIRKAVQAGATDLGENYVQEARGKIEALRGEPITWHFIGHLQSNKAKYVVKLFDLIHSVDGIKLARELDKRAEAIGKTQKVLIQVNMAGENTKSGIASEEALDLVRQVSRLKSLTVQGLMTMPPYFNAPEKVRPFFFFFRIIRDHIMQANIPNVDMKELSMGMTGDFKVAMEEGATIVRVGTAIFGERM